MNDARQWTAPADDAAPAIGCVDLMVDRHVRAGLGDKPALVESGHASCRSLTYAELKRLTARIAQDLQLELGGGRRQQRVAIIGSATLETICAWLGVMRAGHLAFLVHPALAEGDYDALWRTFDPVRVWRDRTVKLEVGECLPEVGWLRQMAAAAPRGADEGRAAAVAQRPALCLTSSGSSGRPKLSVHAHRSFAEFERTVTRTMWGLQPSDRVLASSGPYFSFGLQGIHPALGIGATAVLLPEWSAHADFLEAIARESVSVFLAVPTLYHLLLTRCPLPRRAHRLRLCLSAGERLPDAVRGRWETEMGAPMLDSIGTTETFAPYFSEVVGAGKGLRSVGGFEYNMTLANVVGAAGNSVFEAKIGRGCMMLGYFSADRPAGYEPLPAEFATRDLFVLHAHGWEFVSRASERIKVAGYWVSPQELEEFLLSDARVAQAAAVPIETPEGLQRLRAFIVPARADVDGAALADELMQRAKRELRPKALRPDIIQAVTRLSSTPTGKLRRLELKAQARACS